MSNFKLNETDIEIVSRERYEHPSPMVQKRMTALYLKHIGLTHKQVAEGAQCSMASVTNWITQYRRDGLEGLRSLPGRLPYSKLTANKGTLENYFKHYPVATVQEAQEKIAEITGVRRGKTQIRCFLRSIGLSYRKTGSAPGKADPDKQEEFKKKA
jgi:transposase